MNIYVYPYGISGKQLEWLIKYTDNISIKPIDDSVDEMSLEALKNEILANNGVVYLALSSLPSNYEEIREKLIKKLKDNNIPYKDGEILNYAKKAIQKLKQECKNKGWDRIFTLVLPDFAKDKHFGNLALELEKRGEKILYFCAQEGSFLRALENRDESKNCILYLSYEYLYLLDFTTAICVTGKYNVHKDSKVIFIGHGMVNYGGYDDKYALQNFISSYLCVVGDEFMPNDSVKNEFKIIKSGYLAYDRDVQKLQEVEFSKDCILFAPYNLDELESVKPLIKEVSTKYKVILRHRYEWEESHLKVLGDLVDCVDIDMSVPMDYAVYGKSFVLVCSKTTTKNSFPLMALSPSVVIRPSWDYKDINENLGIVIENTSAVGGAFMALIDEIYKNKDMWREKILEYRESKIYNFGSASAYLADFLSKEFKN